MTLAGTKGLVVGTCERLLDRLGLLGGEWVIYLMAGLGGGRFDCAWLVENLEKLNPANALWPKNYNLPANVDTFCMAVAAADFRAALSAVAACLGTATTHRARTKTPESRGHVT